MRLGLRVDRCHYAKFALALELRGKPRSNLGTKLIEIARRLGLVANNLALLYVERESLPFRVAI